MLRRLTVTLLTGAALALGAAPAAQATHYDHLLPAPGACANDTSTAAAHGDQVNAMLCELAWVRHKAGRQIVNSQIALHYATQRKSVDIATCSFSHTACGRSSFYWDSYYGYTKNVTFKLGENLGRGSGSMGTPRAIMSAWLHSDGHRGVLLNPAFHHNGVWLNPSGGWNYWVLHLGCQKC